MKVVFDSLDLRPLVEAVVRETLSSIDDDRAALGDSLAIPEAKAAALLGIERHTLRDMRLAGKVAGSRLGKRIVYSRAALLELLNATRTCGRAEPD